mmetsp:Transcript_736/g.2643  ORF Transcript_736/g.2643 Transcript_736/m.2643 type:complete len:284 (-) Transcript_736:487-1338(-)
MLVAIREVACLLRASLTARYARRTAALSGSALMANSAKWPARARSALAWPQLLSLLFASCVALFASTVAPPARVATSVPRASSDAGWRCAGFPSHQPPHSRQQLRTTNSGSSYTGRRKGWFRRCAGTGGQLSTTSCSRQPAFIFSTVWLTSNCSAAAVCFSALSTFLSPVMGGPCPGRRTAAFFAAIARSASIHPCAYLCTFCGLPQFGNAQMKRSPEQIVLRSGIHTHVPSSVSPTAWKRCSSSPPMLSTRLFSYSRSGSRQFAGHDGFVTWGNWRMLMWPL